MTHAAEMQLSQRIAHGDARAFEQLMRSHNRMLFRTARAILRDDAEAEDALQEAYLRAYRLDEVIQAHRELQPDVEYYRQRALQTANPFAAGHKSPLWSALHAPILRVWPDQNVSMRLPSWWFGVAMIPLCGWVLGRLLHPVAGVIVAVQPLLPKSDVNRRVPMAGSRFNPLPGERVLTSPDATAARDDEDLSPRRQRQPVGAA